ncbi:MAG: hypothetical protein NC318_10405 [Blautia sp.]|nr:hypothetical protein [Lachnoclostridium sp.]MCM1212004.1 hypothetical protein [Blautia sp.]
MVIGMLSVILIWLYMAGTTFICGYGILTFIAGLCSYRVRKWDAYLMCGLAGTTVYTQIFSLFAPVGAAANLLLSGICLLIVWGYRKKLREDWQRVVQKWRDKGQSRYGWCIVYLFLFLLYAYGTSRGIIHYDTDLYHAQSIRWIEEYGVVKGLGNLHCRLAYNSASFALSALYSMAFLGGQSYHCAAGFLAFLLAMVCLEGMSLFRRKYLKPSDFARVAGIYYLLIIYDEMVSPASDYFMVLTAFYLIIRWMDLLEEGQTEIFPFAMLCVLGVYLMTIKLSAACILLLVLKPALRLLREKRWKEICMYLLLGIVTGTPFLIRNVLISGWLVYPFTSIDFFPVDWKIPQGIAEYDAKEIQVWGRGYSDVAGYDMPFYQWAPAWFRGISGMDKLLVLAAGAAVIVFLLRLLLFLRQYLLFFLRRKSGKLEAVSVECGGDKLFLEGVIISCFLFWLFTSPLIRYGCVYVYLAAAVVFGNVWTKFLDRLDRKEKRRALKGYLEKVSILCIGVFLAYKAVAFGREFVVSYRNEGNRYWMSQKDYGFYETDSYEIEGITFYYPVTGDQAGYESFPSSPGKAEIGLRGDGIEDGFYDLGMER